MLAGLYVGVGTLGTLLATAPLTYAAAAIGWRTVFIGVAVLMSLVGVAKVLVVRKAAPAASMHCETLGESIGILPYGTRPPG
jgi:hypothetical protein